jgi:phage tail-like protein
MLDDGRDLGARYLLEIQSIVVGIFHEVVGLSSEREIMELDEGGRADAVRILGPYAKGAFYLVEGESDDPGLWDWMTKSADGTFASSRRSGCVILVDAFGEERMRWRFRMAAVAEWQGPSDRPRGETYEIERLGIAHEGVELVRR